MTQEVTDFDSYMAAGNENLGFGRFADAAIAFANATDNARNSYENACAYQMMGIALHLNMDCTEAHVAFATATLHSPLDHEMRLRIKRDVAALFLTQGKTHQAAELLEESYHGLNELGIATEAAATLTVLARVELKKGDKSEAYRLLSKADVMLRSAGTDSTHELNNLMWLLKLVSPFKRFTLVPRVLKLIRRTRQKRRLAEVTFLLVGGNKLYDYRTRHRHNPES